VTPRLLVLAAAVLFSTGGAAIKGTVLNSWQVAGARSLVAAVATLLLFPEARRNWNVRTIPVAVSYAATLVLFVSATKLTTAANAILLQGAAPLFVVIFAPVFLKERIRPSQLVFMAALVCGMLLFFAGHEAVRATAPAPVLGNLLAAASAVTWAATITGLRWLGRERRSGRRETGGMATVGLGNLFAALFALPAAFPVTPAAGARDVAIILWLGLFQVTLAYVCLTRGIRAVPAFEATTLLLLEPALNPLWVWMIQGERPAPQSLAGGAMIVLATLANAWWQNRSA
jgi:DME family drug/metabolite transporter